MNIIALEFYRTKQINNINIKSKNYFGEANTNNISKDFQLGVKNNLSTVNNINKNINKTKYEDIKNSSNKDEKTISNNYNYNYNINNNNNNNIYIMDDKNKYLNIKKNLINTALNSFKYNNNYNNNPKMNQNHKHNKSNHFNKTYKNNNYGINNNNIYFKYYK